jgi:hypothetical protein
MTSEHSKEGREVVAHLIDSKAVDFEAIGRALAQFGPTASIDGDGEDVFCATMRRFVRVLRLPDVTSELEQLVALRAATSELRT